MANGDTKTEAMLNVLGNGGSGDEFRGCCNTKTQQYILDAIDRINNIDPSGGGGDIEYVDLTLTGVSQQGFAVTASKYMDEVMDLVEDDKRVVFRITLPSGTGFPTSGTYELPMFNYEDNEKMLAMTVVAIGDTLYAINFGYDLSGIVGDHTNAGIIAIDVVPTGGSGPTVVQTTGTSTTDVMSQNATTGLIYKSSQSSTLSPTNICIGKSSTAVPSNSIAIGTSASVSNNNFTDAIAIGNSATCYDTYDIAIGSSAKPQSPKSIGIGYKSMVIAAALNSIALGEGAKATRKGELNVSTENGGATDGYNNTQYRVIGGVHDGIDSHDAVTLGQLNTRLDNMTILKITQTAYDQLQTKDPNTLYVITGA